MPEPITGTAMLMALAIWLVAMIQPTLSRARLACSSVR
jgi:hypothetical protein